MLGLEGFQGTCFGDEFSKVCKYATTNENVCKGLRYVFVKVAQRDLRKCITWPKNLGKGRQEWEKACTNSSLPPRKLNTPKKTR